MIESGLYGTRRREGTTMCNCCCAVDCYFFFVSQNEKEKDSNGMRGRERVREWRERKKEKKWKKFEQYLRLCLYTLYVSMYMACLKHPDSSQMKFRSEREDRA